MQYVSLRCIERLAEAGVERSAGSVGDIHDHVMAETINGLYKAEVIHRRSRSNREPMELSTLDWVHWQNHKRPLGHVPPAEAEPAHYRRQAGQAMVAPIEQNGLQESRGSSSLLAPVCLCVPPTAQVETALIIAGRSRWRVRTASAPGRCQRHNR